MTAVTVDDTFEGVEAHEYVLLDIDEAFTYVTKLSNPFGASLTMVEDNDSVVNYTLSGRTFTFHENRGTSAVTGVKVFADIVGRL